MILLFPTWELELHTLSPGEGLNLLSEPSLHTLHGYLGIEGRWEVRTDGPSRAATRWLPVSCPES